MAIDISDMRKFDIFQGLNDGELEILSHIMQKVSFTHREIVIKEDDVGEEIYFINSGTISVEVDVVGREGREQVAKLGEGNTVGEFILARKARRSATVKAISDVDTFVTTRAAFMALFETHPRIGYYIFMNLSAILAERMKNANMMMRTLFSSTVGF